MNPDNKNTERETNTVPITMEEKQKSDDFFIRPLRTYEDDVKNAVRRDSISTTKILMAEQRKKEQEQEAVARGTSPAKSQPPQALPEPFAARATAQASRRSGQAESQSQAVRARSGVRSPAAARAAASVASGC